MKLLQFFCYSFVILYFLSACLLYVFQRSLLYHPTPEYKHDFQTLDFTNQEHVLKVNVLNPNKQRAIIYFGGNAEPVIFNAEPFTQNFSNHTIYLVNYRGYGGSTGTPTEEGLSSDALAIYDQLSAKHTSLSVIGRSLGSGVASYLASRRPIELLVLITPYDSIKNVAQAHFRIYPMRLLLKDHYDSIGRVENISAKVLIIIAELDRVIPNSHSIALYKAFAKDQVSTVYIKGADHNNLSLDADYFTSIKRFFKTNMHLLN